DVRRAQRGVPQDFDAPALLAEGGEVRCDRFAGQVAADVLGLAWTRGKVRGAVGLARHGISFAGGSPLQRVGAVQRDPATSWAGLPVVFLVPRGRAQTPRACGA